MLPASYLSHPGIAARLAAAPLFQKSSLTLLRRPTPDELGQRLDTYVKVVGGLRVESRNDIAPGHLIARNPVPIAHHGKMAFYNEWLIEAPVAEASYGAAAVAALTTEFSPHRKTACVRAIELSPELVLELGGDHGAVLFAVPWSDHPMEAREGDFLTDMGYSISAHDMKTTYAPVA